MENSHVKQAGMFVVSHRGENFRFWLHFGCFAENTCLGLHMKKIQKNTSYIFSILASFRSQEKLESSS